MADGIGGCPSAPRMEPVQSEAQQRRRKSPTMDAL